MNPVLRQVAVFAPDGHTRFGIDRVSIACYLVRSRHARYLRLLPEAHERLAKQKAIKRINGRLVAQLTPTFSVALGHEVGADGSCTGFWNTNVMTRLRERLVAEGHYTAEIKIPGAREQNFIEPSALAAHVDVHLEAMLELHTMVNEAVSAYRDALHDHFGVFTTRLDVRASISTIELCWDVPCKTALAASTLWGPAWRDAHRGATSGVGKPSSEPLRSRRTEATHHRETDAMHGTGVLRADAARGGGMKLYAKHDQLLRFEAEFSNDRVSKLIGRRVRVGNAQHMAEDLERLGRGAYERLLVAQSNLLCGRVLSVAELIAAFVPQRESVKIQRLVETFEAGQKFHHSGRTHERQLAHLKRRGLVEYLGSGIWAPRAELHATFKLLQFLRTRSQGPA